MSKDGEKLRNLLINKGIEEKEIAEKFNISVRQVYRYYDSETISKKTLKKFKDHFDIELTNNSQNAHSNATPTTAEGDTPYIHSVIKNNVIYVPCKAFAGWSGGYTNPVMNKDLSVYTLPFLPYMAYMFDVDGESMKRTLRSDERVFVERESLRDYSVFANKVHVIELKDGTYMVKRVSKISKDEIRISSDNPDWKDKQEIFSLSNDIKRIWKVKNALKWDLGFMEDMENLDIAMEEAALNLDQSNKEIDDHIKSSKS